MNYLRWAVSWALYGVGEAAWRLYERAMVASSHVQKGPLGPWEGRQEPPLSQAPALCGHDDGSHCDETCREKARRFREWHAANPEGVDTY